MSAPEPKLVGAERTDATHLRLSIVAADGIAARLSEQEQTIQKLTDENDALEEQKVAFELRASLRFSLLERRVVELEKRLAEVGALADRLAQEQTVRNLRSPEANESLADQLEAHRL